MLNEIILILLLTLVNSAFVMAEMAIISVRKSRLKELVDSGDKRAKLALDLANSPTSFLSTVQVVITLIGILLGAFGSDDLAGKLSVHVRELGIFGIYADSISLWIVIIGITLFSIVLGELVPKRLAIVYSVHIAKITARPMLFVASLSYPIVKLIGFFTDFFLKIFKIKNLKEDPVSEDEIKIMLEHGEEAGVFEELEKDIIERVFKLSDRKINSLMTHRSEIYWISVDDVTEQTWREVAEKGHSYVPVCHESLDDILGLVAVKDIFGKLVAKEELNLRHLIRKPFIVPASITTYTLLERFRETKNRIALVVDEYGGIEGVITMNDILNAVVGQSPPVDENDEPMVVERDDGSYLIDGTYAFDEFEDLLNLDDLTIEERGDFKTLAGFIIEYLGRFPLVGEKFEWQNITFEIVDMDGHKIDKVLVQSSTKASSDGAEVV